MLPTGASNPFELVLPTRIVFGQGSAARTGELARELGASTAFLVTDPGLLAAGHVEAVERALQQSGLEVRRYDQVRENPTSSDVDACRTALGDFPADLVVGLGGGSSIDVAKGCNFLRAGGGRMEDYRGVGRARGRLLPLLAIPTTAGTGTEVQSFALIEEDGTHQKMACGDAQAAPRIAILDPRLTITMPRFVSACTGFDAIGHALETLVTTRRNPFSHLFAREAFRLAHPNLQRILAHPNDLDARGAMLLAACFAGIAIEHSMLGATHSMANPLTAHHDLAHGEAVAICLPQVVSWNAQDPAIAKLYAELARGAGLAALGSPDERAVDALLERLLQLQNLCGITTRLADHGVAASDVDALAAEAARQWTAQFNPRRAGVDELRELFAALVG